MSNTDTEHVAVADLADHAAHAIRLLNHRTRPATADMADPAEAAEIIAALASMTSILPQLLGQLAGWLAHEHSYGRLRVDALAPLPDPAQTVHALTSSLQHATQCMQRAAEELDTAHEHAAHLATAEPPPRGGQHSCRSVGPSHLTKRTLAIAGVAEVFTVDDVPRVAAVPTTAVACLLL
ncbi:MAG: hypothetical protein M3O87_00525, partial [Candidatus Dormibacteraeota bacterium]|nr:hypothetical protein [Candidatus Dormibacteraeota bacterium]